MNTKIVKKKSFTIKNYSSFSKQQLVVFVLIFALIGVYFLYRSFAAGAFASLEPENGTLSGAVTVGTDSTASGGKYVQFGSSPTPPPPPPPPPVGSGTACTSSVPSGFTKLAFCDDFSGASGSSPDTTKWSIFGGTSPSRWGVECFVNDRTHIYVDGQGNLVQTATYNPGGVPCTNGAGLYESGGMNTGSFTTGYTYKYGRAEARIKVPCKSGYGLWPAWWQDGVNWPTGGEIDNLEVMSSTGAGYNANTSLHGPTTTGGSWGLGTRNTSTTLWCTDYHVYGTDWSTGQIKFLIDGVVVRTSTPANLQSGWTWPFDGYPERLFVDLQIGGAGGTIDNASLPQSMLTDYVRVYQ
jgi:beta-glucanase (GH16 family)